MRPIILQYFHVYLWNLSKMRTTLKLKIIISALNFTFKSLNYPTYTMYNVNIQCYSIDINFLYSVQFTFIGKRLQYLETISSLKFNRLYGTAWLSISSMLFM